MAIKKAAQKKDVSAGKQAKKVKQKKAAIQSVGGTRDILPDDQQLWDKVRSVARHVGDFYNFLRIDTPMFEYADLFERGLGKGAAIVEKEMVAIKTKGGERVVLRPECTSAVMRAYVQHGLGQYGQPVKLQYEGPVFRYGQSKDGGLRQSQQVGFEIFGAESDPIYDAQAISGMYRTFEDLKIKHVAVRINSIGCHKCRAAYSKKLEAHYKKNAQKVCKDCRARMAKNPLHVLDCKEETCRQVKEGAPIMLDFLDADCKAHFMKVLEYLDEVKIQYHIDSFLIREFDYHNRTVFEVFAEGFDHAIGSGGRYDHLAEALKVGKFSAVGSVIDIERTVEVLKLGGKSMAARGYAKVFLVHIGEEAKKRGLVLIEEFRKAGMRISESFGKDSLKSQLRIADKDRVQLAMILGQREVFEGSIIIRDMQTGTQESVPIEKVIEEVKKRLK